MKTLHSTEQITWKLTINIDADGKKWTLSLEINDIRLSFWEITFSRKQTVCSEDLNILSLINLWRSY